MTETDVILILMFLKGNVEKTQEGLTKLVTQLHYNKTCFVRDV